MPVITKVLLNIGNHTDEVEPLTRRFVKVSHDKVDAILITVDLGIQRTRPDLGVGGQLIRGAPNVEVQRLQILILRSSDSKITSRPRRYKKNPGI
jgi:hypothetical protein